MLSNRCIVLSILLSSYLLPPPLPPSHVPSEMVLNIGRGDILEAGKEPKGTFEQFCEMASTTDGQVTTAQISKFISDSIYVAKR